MKKHILFVDDEANLLNGLRRMLRFIECLKSLLYGFEETIGNAGYPILMQKTAEMEQLVNNQQTNSLKNQMDELTQLSQRATLNTKKIVEEGYEVVE